MKTITPYSILGVSLLSTFILNEAHAFNVGFNQAWFRDNYAHQWNDSSYDASEARRILDLAQNAGSKTLRVWLFEGPDPQSLIWKNGLVAGVAPDFMRNFEDFLSAAKRRNIKAYVTLFDGNMLRGLKGSTKDRWWNLLNNKNGGRAAFEKNALTPLLALLYRSDYRATIFGIDVMNETDAAEAGSIFANSWSGANEFICGLRSFIRSKKSNSTAIPVTASIGWGAIPFYNRGAANLILEPNPHPSCVDFWDIHFYENDGAIQNCAKIGQLSRQYGKSVYLGEFGQSSKAFDDQVQAKSLLGFIQNAKACGFAGALAWRLSDVRTDGKPNETARFSYEAFGKMRPAYDIIKRWNANQ